ncbi:unnamed protein product, partial [Mesorhabditis belari]|uniref:Uncharacterized protein n=1 Tax=Mesorhabditis belari TaxID=2138241 RepID=A0AAF3F317_9BILA
MSASSKGSNLPLAALTELSNLSTAQSISSDALVRTSSTASNTSLNIPTAVSISSTSITYSQNLPIDTNGLVLQEGLVSFGKSGPVMEYAADPQSTYTVSSGSYSFESLLSPQQSQYRIVKRSAEKAKNASQSTQTKQLKEVDLRYLDDDEPKIYQVPPVMYRAIDRRLRKNAKGTKLEECAIHLEAGDQPYNFQDFQKAWDTVVRELCSNKELAGFKITTTFRDDGEVPEMMIHLKNRNEQLEEQPIDVHEKPFEEWRLDEYEKKAREYLEKQRAREKKMAKVPSSMNTTTPNSVASSTSRTASTARVFSGTTQMATMIGKNIFEKFFGI